MLSNARKEEKETFQGVPLTGSSKQAKFIPTIMNEVSRGCLSILHTYQGPTVHQEKINATLRGLSHLPSPVVLVTLRGRHHHDHFRDDKMETSEGGRAYPSPTDGKEQPCLAPHLSESACASPGAMRSSAE